MKKVVADQQATVSASAIKENDILGVKCKSYGNSYLAMKQDKGSVWITKGRPFLNLMFRKTIREIAVEYAAASDQFHLYVFDNQKEAFLWLINQAK